MGFAAALGLALVTLTGGSGPDPYADHFRATQEARARASAVLAADRAALTAEHGREYDRAVLAAARADRDEAVAHGQQVLVGSAGRVLGESQRQRLSEVLRDATAAQRVADLRLAPVAVGDAVAHVRSATAAWEVEEARRAEEARKAAAAAASRAEEARRAEEVRRAEEGRRAEEARRAEEVQRTGTDDNQQGGEPSQPTDAARSGAGQAGSATDLSPAAADGSLHDQVAGIAARYGCASATIRIDDARLGGANGSADWYNDTILIRSSTPAERLTYVVAHECVHLMQYRMFGGDVDALAARMNSIYGGSGFSGLEQNADCVTQLWGITAWHYTQRCGGARADAATAIAGGTKP